MNKSQWYEIERSSNCIWGINQLMFSVYLTDKYVIDNWIPGINFQSVGQLINCFNTLWSFWLFTLLYLMQQLLQGALEWITYLYQMKYHCKSPPLQILVSVRVTEGSPCRKKMPDRSDLCLLGAGWESLRPGLIPALLFQPSPSENWEAQGPGVWTRRRQHENSVVDLVKLSCEERGKYQYGHLRVEGKCRK